MHDTYYVHRLYCGALALREASRFYTQPEGKRGCDLRQQLQFLVSLMARHDHVPGWKMLHICHEQLAAQ